MSEENRGRWQKGESGNPFGRRPAVNPFRAICQTYSQEAFNKLWKMVDDVMIHEAVRFQALRLIVEQAWGRAPQSMEVKVQERVLPSMLTTEQLKLAIAGQTKELVCSLMETGKLEEYTKKDGETDELLLEHLGTVDNHGMEDEHKPVEKAIVAKEKAKKVVRTGKRKK